MTSGRGRNKSSKMKADCQFSPATTWTDLMSLCLQVKNKSATSQQQVNKKSTRSQQEVNNKSARSQQEVNHNLTTSQRELNYNLTTSRQRLTDQGVQVCGGGKSESVLSQFADTNLKIEKNVQNRRKTNKK